MVVCQCGTQTFPWALPGGRFYNGGKNHYHSRVRWQRRVSAPVLKEHGKGGERRERGRGNHNLICEEFNACQWCRAVSSIITAYPLLLQCSSLEKFRGEKNIRSENIFFPLLHIGRLSLLKLLIRILYVNRLFIFSFLSKRVVERHKQRD